MSGLKQVTLTGISGIGGSSGGFANFREEFTGDGIDTTFQLTGATTNGNFTGGSWVVGNVLTGQPSDAARKDNLKPVYTSSNIFTRSRVSVVSISAGGLVTLDNPPQSGVDFNVYYWYDLNVGDKFDNYQKDDVVTEAEVDTQIASQVPMNPAVPTDWDVLPTELQGSTDELASRLRSVEGDLGDLPTVLVLDTSYTLTGGAYTGIPFATTQIENDPSVVEHNNTFTERLEVKETGLYLCGYEMDHTEGATGGNTKIRVAENGTTLVPGTETEETTINGFRFAKESTKPVELSAGDYVEMQVEGGSGTFSNICFYLVKQQGIKGEKGDPGSGSTITTQEDDINVEVSTEVLNFEGPKVSTTNEGSGKVTHTVANQDASEVSYDNSSSDLTATNDQAAIDELTALHDTGDLSSGPFTFSNNTTASDPGSGGIKLNNATQSSSTAAYVSDTDEDGLDRTAELASAPIGRIALIKSGRDSARFHLIQTTGIAVDNGSWFTIPITVLQSGSDLQNNKTVIVSGIGPGIPDNSVTNDKLAQMPTLTLKGNDTGGLADAKDLTAAEARTLLGIERVKEYHPPAWTDYAVGSGGATLALTTDGEGYRFGHPNGITSKIHKKLPLRDLTSQLDYDGSTVNVKILYQKSTGGAGNVALEFNYGFISIGDNYETTSNTLATTVNVTGAAAGNLFSWNIGNISGTSGALTFKTNSTRVGGAVSDTYTGVFRPICIILTRV